MSEKAHDSQQESRDNAAVQITIHELEPGQRLQLPPFEHTVVVTEGLLYVVLDDDELALIPGEEVVIPRDRLEFAWNAGSDRARIAAMRR
jgi:quercetin dioxygenase-like cupin family protein